MTVRMLSEAARGVFIICATPFTERGALDLGSTDSLIEFYIGKGVSGLTVLGMMGEAQKLSREESSEFLRHVLGRVGGRLPVVVGVSSEDRGRLLSLAELAMDSGAGGVMVAPVTGLANDAAVYEYFSGVMEALGENVPVCYQDYPFATASAISVRCFNRLVRDYPQLVMLKHEDCPGLNKLSDVRATARVESLRRVSILVGNGGLYLPQELARGADGAMTGFAYPEMLVDVVRLFDAGQRDRAEDLFDAYLPLVRYEQQPNFGLAVRKETLRRRGAINSAHVREPGPRMSDIDHEELTRLMRRVERNVEALRPS
jgi:4-hydroxy-tetrahydrodipicolinate synthase